MDYQPILTEAENSEFQLFSDIDYLKIDIANNLGLDKLSYQERIQKFDEHIGSFLPTTTPPEDLISFMTHKLKDFNMEHALVYAGLLAYMDYLNNRPSGYRVSFDAVASGTQIMSALTCDVNGMYLTGILGNTRNDIYTEFGKTYINITGQQFESFSDLRTKLKEAFMTHFYGSKDRPRKLVGDGNLPYFYETAKTVCYGASKLRNILVQQWDSTKDVQSWLLPDGYTAYCPVEVLETHKLILDGVPLKFKIKAQKPSEYELSNSANAVHS